MSFMVQPKYFPFPDSFEHHLQKKRMNRSLFSLMFYLPRWGTINQKPWHQINTTHYLFRWKPLQQRWNDSKNKRRYLYKVGRVVLPIKWNNLVSSKFLFEHENMAIFKNLTLNWYESVDEFNSFGWTNQDNMISRSSIGDVVTQVHCTRVYTSTESLATLRRGKVGISCEVSLKYRKYFWYTNIFQQHVII